MTLNFQRLVSPRPLARASRSPLPHSAYTLPELMVSMALMVLVTFALMYTNLFGAKMAELTAAKLTVSQQGRHMLGRLASEIRAAKTVQIGTVSSNVFAAVAAGSLQQGGAVRIYESTNSASYICYYHDSSTRTLRRSVNAIATGMLIAEDVTNSIVFIGQDDIGTTLNGLQANPVVQVSLEFSHDLYGNPGNEAQRLQSRVARRVL